MTAKERAYRTYKLYAKARESRGLNDHQVACITDIASATLCDWKHGRYTPKMDKLQKISNALGIPLEMFTEGMT